MTDQSAPEEAIYLKYIYNGLLIVGSVMIIAGAYVLLYSKLPWLMRYGTSSILIVGGYKAASSAWFSGISWISKLRPYLQ